MVIEPYGAGVGSPFGSLPWALGVDVFFMISGFVMVHASGPLFGQPGAARTFMARRIARVVPLYWATTTAYLAIAFAMPGRLNAPQPGADAIAASYAFIPWARPDGLIQPVYSLGWTLNYEMFFYVVFALFVGLPRGRALLGVAGALGCAVMAGAALRPEAAALRFWTDPIMLEFLAGMGFAVLAGRGVILPGRVRILLAVAALFVPALGAAMPGIPALAWRMAAAALLIAAAALGPEPPMPRWLQTAMGKFGDASYAIYLVHPFLLRIVAAGWAALALSRSAAAICAGAVALLLVSAVSLASHRWFEAPMTWRLSALLGGTGAPRPGAPRQAG